MAYCRSERIVNFRTSILFVCLLLTLSVEFFAQPHMPGDGDQQHALVSCGNEPAELDEQMMGSSDESIFNGLDVMTSPMKLEGMDMATVSLPVAQPYVSSRRHRWLCVERC